MTFMTDMNAVAKVLWLIDNRDITQADAARAMTVAPSRVSEWRKRLAEGEKVTLTTAQAFGAARLFGVSMDWLADDDADVPPVASELSDDMRVILAIVGDLGPKVARQRLVKSPALEVETVHETEEQRRYAAGLAKGKPKGGGRKSG